MPNARRGAAPTGAYLTLTTCHPKYSARQRLIVHAVLDGDPISKADDARRPTRTAGGLDRVYGWIWRHLPGATASKALLALVLLLAVVALLLFVVFPWVEPRLPFNDVTVDQ